MSDMFTQVVSTFGRKFASEFGLTDVQSCGPWGSFGHETGGFKFFQEVGSRSNTGGRGWGQWTGPRRIAFLAWCKSHGLDPQSNAANYGYLCFELHGSYAHVIVALKRCQTLEAAVSTFERLYEGARIKAIASRAAWGRKALAILSPGHPATAAPPVKTRAPMAKKASPRARHHWHA